MQVEPLYSAFHTMTNAQLQDDIQKLEADKLKNPQNAALDEQEEECLKQLQKLGEDFQKTGNIDDANQLNALYSELKSLIEKNHVQLDTNR